MPLQGTYYDAVAGFNKDKEEKDPLGKSSKDPGSKLDAGKAPIMRGIMQYFPRALWKVALLSLKGANKYTWKGWESVPDGPNRYGDALGRHLLMEEIEGPYDSDFPDGDVLHATEQAWNALARLELILREKEKVKLTVNDFSRTEQMDPS